MKSRSLLTSYLSSFVLFFRMVKICRVADNFHSRFLAKNRQYCYRVALYEKDGGWDQTLPHLSVFDRERIRVVK
jgi:tRNA U38,U39,U40 pseudouridine synthase TruA